jgi:hypothetical protein
MSNPVYALGAAPIDRDAQYAIKPSKPEDNYEYVPKPSDTMVFDAPPPRVSRRRGGKEMRPENLAGRTVGRMTVMAYYGKAGGQTGTASQKWACRCPCGTYVIRTAKTIKAGVDKDDCCVRCRRLKHLIRDDLLKRTFHR